MDLPGTGAQLRAPRPSAAEVLLAAALALPGLAATTKAAAQGYPDQPILAFKNLNYSDSQPGQARMRLNNPTYYLYTPVTELFSIESVVTRETLSGASPLFQNTLSGASGTQIREHRNASDLKLIGFAGHSSAAVQVARSKENDFLSKARTLELRIGSASGNTTLALASSDQHDEISATGFPLQEFRATRSYFAGLTQVLSQVSVAQTSVTYSEGHGFFSDPYKALDNRPRSRGQFAWLTRYNRYFTGSESALHLDYRYYRDNWSVEGHTVDAAYYFPFGSGWTVRPRLRYHTQKSAYFYSSVFPPPVFGKFYSTDQRLGTFGAVDAGIKLSRELSHDVTIDIKAERYVQRAKWRLWGGINPEMQSYSGNIVMFGATKKF